MHNGALRKWALALTFWVTLYATSLRAQIFTAPLKASTTGTNPVDFEFRADGTLIGMGNYGVGSLLSGDQGAGTRMLWFPSRGAFRAGGASDTEWDAANIGPYSAALGYGTTASGSFSTALGGATTASGTYATAFGFNTASQAMLSFSLGQYNVGGGTGTSWVPTDPLFEIGNGTASVPSDALVVYKNGNMTVNGIDNEMPNQTLVNANSVLTEGLADGRYASSASIIVGSATTTQGGTAPTLSLNGGYATGAYSFAEGETSSTGIASTSMGSNSSASGNYSTAMGQGSTATGSYSTAMGGYSTADGSYSTASGFYTQAQALESFVVGSMNIGGGNPTNWIPTDPLFEIGNGTSSTGQSDALVVYKNGNAAFQGAVSVAPGGDIPMYTGN
jgi:hypothetical protein